MKTIFLTFISFLMITSTSAREFNWLFDVFKVVNHAYTEVYGDNNYIEFEHFNTNDINAIPDIEIARYDLKPHEAFGDIKKCVFMQEGAYGQHIDNRKANELTRLFIEQITRGWIQNPKIYVLENIQYEIINNNCAILLVGSLNRESIIMQGVSFD